MRGHSPTHVLMFLLLLLSSLGGSNLTASAEPPDNCPGVDGDSQHDRTGCPDTDGDGWSDPDGNGRKPAPAASTPAPAPQPAVETVEETVVETPAADPVTTDGAKPSAQDILKMIRSRQS